MVVFSQYAMQVIMAFAMLTVMIVMLPRVMVSVYRINEVLDMPVKIKDGKKTAQDSTEKGKELILQNGIYAELYNSQFEQAE